MKKDIINSIFDNAGELVAEYMKNTTEASITAGNVAICIIETDGTVHGKMFGNDKIRNRDTFKTAWIKASQVWITGVRTGEYERMVFNGHIDDSKYGIALPELIGWEGGMPVALADGTQLSIAFSGFTGKTDVAIINRTIEQLNL